jgi:hypothetical protein
MEEKPDYNLNYKKGDTVICIINSRASLTVGKEYKVIEAYGHSSTDLQDVWDRFKNEGTLVIENDQGENTWYDHIRFVPKNEFRQHIINDILKK